jgi:anti-anti-sigma factor
VVEQPAFISQDQGEAVNSNLTVSVHRYDSRATIFCAGDLDAGTVEEFRESLATCFEPGIMQLHFDGKQIRLLTSFGIEALLDLVRESTERSIKLTFDLSSHARSVLDVVGLWWLGVVDDWASVHKSMEASSHFSTEPPLPLYQPDKIEGVWGG